MGKSTLALALALSALYAGTACGADMDLFDLSLRDLMDMPVQGSTLTQETVSTAPTAVTVFDQSFIQSIPVDYLYELLNYVPGIQSQRGADSSFAYGYSVRGRRNGNQSKEVLLLLDGHVINDPRTGAANGSVRLLTVDQINRVEVIRGPGSAIYGSGAYGGVINVVTRKGMNEAALGTGSWGQAMLRSETAWTSGRWNWDGYVYASRDDGDDYNLDDTFSNDPNERIRTTDGRRIVDAHGQLSYGNTRMSIVWNEVQGGEFYSLESTSNENSFNRYIHRGVHVKHDFSLTDSISSVFELQHTYIQQHLDSQITAPGALVAISNPSSSDPAIIKALVKAEGYRFAINNDWQMSRDFSVQFGMNWQKNRTLTSEAADNFHTGQLSDQQFPVDYYGDFSHVTYSDYQAPQTLWGLYGQALVRVADQHHFNLGLRFDTTDSVDSHWSPRVGWVYDMSENNTFKLLYGEAFRAASLSETSNTNSTILRGNLDLEHEVIKTVDAIFQHRQADVNLQAGLFYNHYKTPIVIIINSQDIREYVNGPSDDGYGIEFEMNWSFAKNYWLRTSFAELLDVPEAFFREGSRMGSVSLTHSHNAWQWSVTSVYESQTETEVSEGVFRPLPSHWNFGVKASYQHNVNSRSVVQIKNLGDEQYAGTPQGKGLPEGVPNRGREIGYQFEYVW